MGLSTAATNSFLQDKMSFENSRYPPLFNLFEHHLTSIPDYLLAEIIVL